MNFARLVSNFCTRQRLVPYFSQRRFENQDMTVTPAAEDHACVGIHSNSTPNSYSYPTPILFNELLDRGYCYEALKKREYNPGIIALGVSHAFSYMAYFCRYEGRKRGLEVVSVTSNDGSDDKELVTNFYDHFVEKLEIVSVNANPEASVEFKTVDDLVEKRPNIVDNCVLLLIWPEFVKKEDETTEIDVIRKLQPRAVLTIYEVTGMCGSDDFRAYLRGDKDYPGWDRYANRNHGLDNYAIKELGHQEVVFEFGQECVVPGSEPLKKKIMGQGERAFEFKIVQLMRTDCQEEDSATLSSTADV